MYASQWFLTLFTAKFPLQMVFFIIDLFLTEVSTRPPGSWLNRKKDSANKSQSNTIFEKRI